LEERLGIAKELFGDGAAMLSAFGRKRGFLVKGGEVDFTRASLKLLDDFRSGALGRITLERAE
jgi:ribosome biogenesis GTPase A